MFIFPEKNNTGHRPVPFHQHSPLYTLKVTVISENSIVCNANEVVLSDEIKNVDFKSFVVWVTRMSD